MGMTWTIFKRELVQFFITPVAYVFIVIFLLLAGSLTFFLGNFFQMNQAGLEPFFAFHPWLYLFLIPALSMRLWAEERRQGTIELLMTLPVPLGASVLGKFLAAWAFTGIALALTFPIWMTVNYLGEPDNGVILASYLGSLLMAGGFLSLGSFVSALTKNQIVAFVVSLLLCLLLVLAGFPMVTGFFAEWASPTVLETIAGFSFLSNFHTITRGVIDARSVVFFLTLIATFLFATMVVIDRKKAD